MSDTHVSILLYMISAGRIKRLVTDGMAMNAVYV